MTFAHAWVLLLLAIPLLLGWAILTRGHGAVAPVDHNTPRVRRPRTLAVLLGVFESWPLLALAAVIIMLASPQVMKQPRRERQLTNIQICMDVSGSMAGRNYEIASKAIEDFTFARDGDAFGLTLFGVAQIRWLPLTKDLQAVRNALPFADPTFQPSHMGGTAIAAALRFCTQNMLAEAQEGDRIIILVSDGVSFDLQPGDEDDLGDELRAAGVTVYHIHVDESDIPDAVAEVARLSGGDAFRATDSQSLKTVFNHIDRMRPAKFASMGAVPMDHFAPFALVALVMLSLHVIGLMGVRYTPW